LPLTQILLGAIVFELSDRLDGLSIGNESDEIR
jgi:hypothetical protein